MHTELIFKRPTNFLQCHASTLAVIPDGRTLAAWFGGARESAPNTAIWMSVLNEGKWSAPHKMAKVMQVAHWNPVLFVTPSGSVNLYFKIGERPECTEQLA